MSVIKALGTVSQRLDKKVVVQVPATATRKAYSYERDVSEGATKTSGSKKINVAISRLGGPAIIAAGLVGAQVVRARSNRRENEAFKERMNEYTKRQEQYREKWSDFYENASKGRTSSKNSEDSAYEALGIKKGASQSEIQKAYKEIAKKHHPDVDKSEQGQEIMKNANAAMDVLDPRKKAAQEAAKAERRNSTLQRIDSWLASL